MQFVALMIGIVGLLACVLSGFSGATQPFSSYLFGCLFWLGLSLGCLVVAMIHYLTGGRWGNGTRRFLEAGFMTLPCMVVLFIPVIFSLNKLYAWAQPAVVAADKTLQSKSAYLNPTGFIIRAVVYFLIWITIATCLRRWSLQQDTTTDVSPLRRMRTLSGPGVAIYALTVTFAYIDWVMSLEPDWYSTMFPVIICIGQILSAYTFCILMLAWSANFPPFREAATVTQFHQLGNLLLAFVMFWTYIVFAQFLINWSGNTPKEILWHQHRFAGSWKSVVAILVIFHFFVPFLILLFRSSKQRIQSLAILAAMLFSAQVIAVFWLIAPAFHQTGLSLSWLDIASFFGVGGIWLAVFIASLKRHPMLARNDPRMEAIAP